METFKIGWAALFLGVIYWVALCENVFSSRCEQAKAQISLRIRINGKQMHGWHFAHAQGESEFVLFAHARRHVFALRGQNKVQTLIWCTAHAICSCLEFILLHFNSINLDGQVKYPCKRCRFRGVISKVSTQSVIVHYYYYYYYYDT